MSQQAKQLLGVPENDANKNSKRKMTQGILDEQEKDKDKYEFLEEDDDFEEFEFDPDAMDDMLQADDQQQQQDKENTLWKQDWDDEEADEDFARQLKSQLQAR